MVPDGGARNRSPSLPPFAYPKNSRRPFQVRMRATGHAAVDLDDAAAAFDFAVNDPQQIGQGAVVGSALLEGKHLAAGRRSWTPAQLRVSQVVVDAVDALVVEKPRQARQEIGPPSGAGRGTGRSGNRTRRGLRDRATPDGNRDRAARKKPLETYTISRIPRRCTISMRRRRSPAGLTAERFSRRNAVANRTTHRGPAPTRCHDREVDPAPGRPCRPGPRASTGYSPRL